MKLLVLGGTEFLGRAVSDTALERGHELTLFNRGFTNPELYPHVEKLRGDRDGDISALTGRKWDAVIDTSGYVPYVVRASLETLVLSGHYCFVSSISVYADYSTPMDEDSPVRRLGDDPVDALTRDFSNYGALKALCEDDVREVFDDRALVIRPGLIVGPHDPSGRFTYWPHRIARGGEVLAPAPPDRHAEFVDARDLGSWIVGLCERGVGGTFNATHPGISWGELLESCQRGAASSSTLTWVSDEFLLENEVREWMELPLWVANPARAGVNDVIVDRALAAGLGFRPLVDTIRGTLDEAQPTEAAGLSPEREAALLEAWHAR